MHVILTNQLKLTADRKVLLKLMGNFNSACDWLSQIAFEEKLWHWLPLQQRTYHELRERFSMTAAQALVAIRKVATRYRNRTMRSVQVSFKPLGTIPLFKHVYYEDGTVRFYGIRLPYQAQNGVLLPRHPKEGNLICRDGEFYIHQPVEVERVKPLELEGFLGCDLGIVNLLTDSEGQQYSGQVVNGLRLRHARLRAKLQTKGTKSAKRLLVRRRHKEARFARYENHRISKQVVAKAKRQRQGIALENLKGIRDRFVVRKAQRRQHHAWGFGQLRQFLTYKATLLGVPILLVDPRNTSRACPACGYVDKANRKSQARFECVQCGFAGHADIIAAGNIARRAVGNQPYADTTSEVSCEYA